METIKNADDNFDAIDAALDDLFLEEIEASEAVTDAAEIIEEPVEELSDEEERVLAAEITKSEAYEGQELDSAAIEIDPESLKKPSKVKKPRAAKAAKAPRTPKSEKAVVVRDLRSLPPEAFVTTPEAPSDLEANKEAILSSLPTQKKVKEKVENLLISLHAGRKPSVYTLEVFKALNVMGTASSRKLVEVLVSTPSRSGSFYSNGTANAQVGQMMIAFDKLGIAKRNGQELTLIEDSPLVSKLRAL